MMADGVEAASKSLKEPTYDTLADFVTKIIDQQMEEKQFINANITLAEIETVKKYCLISWSMFIIYELLIPNKH